ncbi:SCO4402 family protein [Stackebrandtia albiflava]|uniref:SCO4402 family protein n=1 Tax=Stackebrandtia albiflava TaxID=406432 RepID=UPI0011BFE21D|nr:hypothetical protein [Stackebrandtia albiflava]
MRLSELKFPAMRRALIETMTSLSDRDYQQRVWIDEKYPQPGFFDDLTTTVNVFHDLIADDEDVDRYVGAFLVSGEEATAVERVYRALDPMIDDLADSPDDRYLSDPRWTDVVTAATRAKALLNTAR